MFNNGDLYNPRFRLDWNLYTLYSLAEWINGKAFRKTDYSEKGYPVIKIAELNRGIDENTQYASKDKFDEKFQIKKSDILFAWSGNPKTSINSFRYTYESGWLNQHIFKVIPKESIDKNYLYYLLKYLNPNFEMIASNKQTTGLGHVTKNDLKNIQVRIPKISDQIIISEVLSSFDNKIENNNAIIANLEEQVQAIYKSWFVDFEPFLEEEFVDSELGKTPKSWKVVKLGDVSKEIVTGKTPSTKVPENYGDKMPFVTIPDMHDRVYVTKTERSLSDKGFKTQEKKIVPKNSIAVSCIATVGLVTLIAEDSITNQQINTVKPKEKISLYYLYSYLKTQSDFLNAIGSSGSTTKNVNKTTFSNLKLLLPSVEVLEKYHKLCEPIFDYILLIQKQNEKLIRTRDTLLPKLMSGEIRVEEAVESK